jgi:hypothetical protein
MRFVSVGYHEGLSARGGSGCGKTWESESKLGIQLDTRSCHHSFGAKLGNLLVDDSEGLWCQLDYVQGMLGVNHNETKIVVFTYMSSYINGL